MSQVGYLIAKIKYVFGGRNPEIINDYFRKQGVESGIGHISFQIFQTASPI